MNPEVFPSIVQQLAASVGGIPIAWREYDDHFVIVMEDGRKLAFVKDDPAQARRQQTLADFKEKAGHQEANRKATKAQKGD